MLTYKPRNDFVVFELIDLGMVGGVHVPDRSAHGKERIIRAVGPDVKGLDVGQKVFVIGTMGEDVVPIPDKKQYYLTKQSNVVLIVCEEDEEFDDEHRRSGR